MCKINGNEKEDEVGEKTGIYFNPKAGKGKIKTSLMDIVDILIKAVMR